MSSQWLVLWVHWHAPRYHGVPDWPPAPARLFQALVAGAAAELAERQTRDAFLWFERLEPPVIGVPHHKMGRSVTHYVPNNDLDRKGGDPARLPEIRVAKDVTPRLLTPGVPAVYAWRFSNGKPHAQVIAELANRLYQLGRGMDMAWATVEICGETEVEAMWARYRGVVHRPSGGSGRRLACPVAGTLQSLEVRHSAQATRFVVEGRGTRARQIFVQPPKPVVAQAGYDSPPIRLLWDLRPVGVMDRFGSVTAEHVVTFTSKVRDSATSKLRDTLTHIDPGLLGAAIVGRRPGEEALLPIADRVRFVPLPSIGHEHVEPRVRRLLVEVPQTCPVQARDVRWALSGVEIDGCVLVEAQDHRMLRRYLERARRWQSITPVALSAGRRRIDPARRLAEAKPAGERAEEETVALRELAHALRRSGIHAHIVKAHVQREPVLRKGRRAEAFAVPPRFAKERLWHIEVLFDRPVAGPLVIGDGRFLGLGIMAPAPDPLSRYAWNIVDGLVDGIDPLAVTIALRRAVLARTQNELGPGRLPTWVSGHDRHDNPAEGHEHLYFVFDVPRQRLLVVDPLGGAGSSAAKVQNALDGLTDLRAGRAGRLTLARTHIDDGDPLFARSRVWQTVTPYRVERHSRGGRDQMIHRDVLRACGSAGLPRPAVRVLDARGRPGQGVDAELELKFEVPVEGPILLGRTRHRGGGLFAARLPAEVDQHDK